MSELAKHRFIIGCLTILCLAILLVIDLWWGHYLYCLLWISAIVWFLYDMGIFRVKIFQEKPGIISKEKCWVAILNGTWLYTSDTLFGLIRQLITEWKHDKHLSSQ